MKGADALGLVEDEILARVTGERTADGESVVLHFRGGGWLTLHAPGEMVAEASIGRAGSERRRAPDSIGLLGACAYCATARTQDERIVVEGATWWHLACFEAINHWTAAELTEFLAARGFRTAREAWEEMAAWKKIPQP